MHDAGSQFEHHGRFNNYRERLVAEIHSTETITELVDKKPVTRLREDAYLVISADGTHTSIKSWLKDHIPPEAHATVTDISARYNILNLQ